MTCYSLACLLQAIEGEIEKTAAPGQQKVCKEDSEDLLGDLGTQFD